MRQHYRFIKIKFATFYNFLKRENQSEIPLRYATLLYRLSGIKALLKRNKFRCVGKGANVCTSGNGHKIKHSSKTHGGK